MKKRYILWDHPDAGGDDTLLTCEPILDEDGNVTDWSKDRELARRMTAKQVVKQLQKHDSGYLLRSRLWIVAVEDVDDLPIHGESCSGDCGGSFKCTGIHRRKDAPKSAGKGCGKTYGYCLGASDDMPEHCDFCWTREHDAEEKTA